MNKMENRKTQEQTNIPKSCQQNKKKKTTEFHGLVYT